MQIEDTTAIVNILLGILLLIVSARAYLFLRGGSLAKTFFFIAASSGIFALHSALYAYFDIKSYAIAEPINEAGQALALIALIVGVYAFGATWASAKKVSL